MSSDDGTGGEKSGPQQRGELLLSRVNAGMPLKGFDGRDVDLEGRDLSNADLRGVDMRGARLRRANLTRADLRGVQLQGANMAAARLGGARMASSQLANARLDEANLRDADLRNAHMVAASLRGAVLRRANLRGADLSRVDLANALLAGAHLSFTCLAGAELGGVRWRYTSPKSGRTDRATINFHTYERSGWNPEVLGAVHGEGVVVIGLEEFPEAARRSVLGSGPGLILSFDSRLHRFDATAFDALIAEILGPGTDVTIEGRSNVGEEPAFLRINGSRPEDLLAIAEAFYERIWRSACDDENALAALPPWARLVIERWEAMRADVSEIKANVALLADGDVQEAVNDLASEHVVTKRKKEFQTGMQRLAEGIAKEAPKKFAAKFIGETAAEAAGDILGDVVGQVATALAKAIGSGAEAATGVTLDAARDSVRASRKELTASSPDGKRDDGSLDVADEEDHGRRRPR